jgi:predicted outer membrane repeat protein
MIVYNYYSIQKPFLFKNNTFDGNRAEEIGGALYLDYTYSEKNIIGNLSSTILNITNIRNITVIE